MARLRRGSKYQLFARGHQAVPCFGCPPSREYYAALHDGDSVHQYAQNFRSTPGKQDGLYWEVKSSEQPESPLGPLVAKPIVKATDVPLTMLRANLVASDYKKTVIWKSMNPRAERRSERLASGLREWPGRPAVPRRYRSG